MRYSLLAAVTTSVLGAGLLPGLAATAEAAVDGSVLGTTAETAAGSCWEIKEQRPAATDGAYWLLTPRMAEPAQFYCDMTTDGGGWVLVGKGRDGWVDAYDGQGAASELLTPGLATMGPRTTQLPAQTVDALLNGGRVDALTDGVRLRRAANAEGTAWQEARLRLANRDRWVWTFGGEHPLSSWSIDTRTGSGGQTRNVGADNNYLRVVATPQQSQGYRLGFAFGSGVRGTAASTTYLYSQNGTSGYALPFTQVYLRPRVTSADPGFARIGDGGASGATRVALPKSRALDSPWGVTGTAGNTTIEGNVEVQAFAEGRIGTTPVMYVGGNFAAVQQDAAGTGRVSQPFLAAFEVASGQLVTTFRPVLNEQVHTLAVLPDGTVLAGGRFTTANGAASSGVVALDPATGATRTGWRARVENRTTPSSMQVQVLEVRGDWVYVGGNFTHVTGGTRTSAVQVKNLGRVSVANGTPDTAWNGRLNGTVTDLDISTDGTRAYVSGYFGTAGGVAAKRAAVFSTAAGAALTPFAPTWSSTRNDYQRAVEEVGGRVYYGGSEHSLFGFDTSTLQRVSGSIAQAHGDIQAVATGDGILYAGCHCDDYVYEGTYTWPRIGSGFTQGDAIGWFAAWDAATGRQLPSFVPSMRMRLGSGIWAITVDSAGNVWAGGDIASATTKSQAAKWAGGFVRFDRVDAFAPTTPAALRVVSQTDTTVTLAWNASTDRGDGGIRYQVLRDDRPLVGVGSAVRTVTVPKGGENRFFVRATDAAGNSSATSAVVAVP